jgi:serine/threonine protein kinase/ankyrin repeat protein
VETNTVYKRNIWSTQRERIDTIHQHGQLQTFINEIRVLGRFRSIPNIIDLVGVAWEQDSHAQISPVLALEYAQHNSLTRFLSDNARTTTFREKRRLIQDVACGLSHIHGADFVWGDCKPDNVLICQHAYDRTSLTAKISDFGLSVAGTSDTVRFLGFSMPWISREARDAVGMTALRQSEMYSLGLVIWSILLSGKHFRRSRWTFDRSLETEQDGNVSSRQVFALTVAGELQTIACKSIESRMPSVISENEMQTFSTVLRESLSLHPHCRPSAKELYQALLQGAANNLENGTSHEDGHEEFNMEWLTSNFGPNTRLHAVGIKILQHLITLSSDVPSAATEFKLGVCYATGFGCKRNLHLAIQHMHHSAVLGHNEAPDLYKKLVNIARDFVGDPKTASCSVSATLIDLWDDCDSDNGNLTSDAQNLVRQHQVNDLSTRQVKIDSKGKRKAGADAPIRAAMAQGDLEGVKACMSNPGFNFDHKNEQQEGLLVCAILGGHHEIFQMLLHAGADPSVTDQQNRTILHALSSLNGPSLDSMIAILKDEAVLEKHCFAHLISIVAVATKSGDAVGARPGTPLEWAVDARNTAVVRYLLHLGSDPSASDSGWPALHRAASRHDCKMLAILLTDVATEALMRYDHSGRSPLACAVADIHAFDRLLMSEGNQDLSERIMRMVRDKGHDLKKLNIATDSGESIVYHSLRSNKLTPHTISAFWDWDWERQCTNVLPGPTDPNQWSALRRAMYCSNVDPFALLCNGLEVEHFEEALQDISPDGLTIFHELAFLPTETATTIIDIILKRARHHKAKLKLTRMGPRDSRPRLTPFQLAVICGNTVLAKTYVDNDLDDPLAGLGKSRFLAFVIEYPAQDPYTLSTWLSLIREDPIVEATRRFPHPTSMSNPLQYLLQNEKAWWQKAKERTSFWRESVLGESPCFDNHVKHDPFISWTPNLRTALDFDMEGEQSAAVVHYGADHVLDNNIFGLGHRLRHTLDYGSFLLRSNPNAQAHNSHGHPYVTALELGLSVVLKSDYTIQAKQNFNTLLRHFRGPEYCNFPYYQYLPTGRMRFEYLRRRETILHRAVRHGQYEIVQSLITAGADIYMANNTWQTPLHLARLIAQGKNPDEYGHRGAFLGRLGPSVAPVVFSSVSHSAKPSEKILGALEKETVKAKRWSLPRFRALREVKWPWDEYETDELGLRFVLFYLAVLLIFLGILTLISRLLLFVPFILYNLGSVLVQGSDELGNIRACFLNGTRNGSSTYEACHLDRWTLAPLDIPMIIPAVDHRLQAVLDVLDDCYDPSTNATLTTPDPDVDEEPFLPGCPDLDTLGKDDRILDAALALNRAVYKFLEQECKCKCSWFNEPRTGFDKTADLG